ncbi:MAG: dipicolinate synthase subunit B [Clostridiales bacterium]|nr:dipicolinate synthase subunit B [Clostridiales bacterium]
MLERLRGAKAGWALTGSFCTIPQLFDQISSLKEAGCEIFPILSPSVSGLDTRFQSAESIQARLFEITGKLPIETLQQAEPIGPKKLLDVLVVLPATGNTLAKLAAGIADTSVTLAVKAHLRNERPVIIGVSTNDGLSGNAKSIGILLNTRNIYFVPFFQDDPIGKTRSLVCHAPLVKETIAEALNGRQIQPLLYRG